MITILDNIRSVHNVGSIFRTSDALGIKKIYLTGITPIPIDRFGEIRQDFKKTALGAERSVRWEYARDAIALIKKLKKEKFKIVSIEQSKKSIPYYKLKANSYKLVLVVGNEVKGLSKSVLKLSDTIVEIPMMGTKESLNVAVAFSVVAFHLKYERFTIS